MPYPVIYSACLFLSVKCVKMIIYRIEIELSLWFANSQSLFDLLSALTPDNNRDNFKVSLKAHFEKQLVLF